MLTAWIDKSLLWWIAPTLPSQGSAWEFHSTPFGLGFTKSTYRSHHEYNTVAMDCGVHSWYSQVIFHIPLNREKVAGIVVKKIIYDMCIRGTFIPFRLKICEYNAYFCLVFLRRIVRYSRGRSYFYIVEWWGFSTWMMKRGLALDTCCSNESLIWVRRLGRPFTNNPKRAYRHFHLSCTTETGMCDTRRLKAWKLWNKRCTPWT